MHLFMETPMRKLLCGLVVLMAVSVSVSAQTTVTPPVTFDRALRLIPTDVQPASPQTGTFYYDLSENVFKVWNGSAWATMGGGGAPGGSDTQVQFNDGGAFGGFGSWDGSHLELPSSGDSNAPSPNYTVNNSGLIIRDVNGVETLRIWGSDPQVSFSNFNTWNTYVGARAGLSQPSDNVSAGYGNTGVGTEALKANTQGTFNTALGLRSLQNNTIGVNNTGLGGDALQNVVSGDYNTGVGSSALLSTTGDYNIGVGSFALFYNTDGSGNVGVGLQAGRTVANTNNDHRSISDVDMVFIGRNASRQISGAISNGIAIGADATVSASNRAVIGNGSVSAVYIGSESANALLHSSGVVVMNGGSLRTTTTTAHTALISAYDVDGAAYKTFGTLTNGNTPDFTLSAPSGGTMTVQPSTYKSADGTAGVTVTTCTGFKDGLCISGT